jgi:biopolymer transport protein ExbB/TolQ
MLLEDMVKIMRDFILNFLMADPYVVDVVFLFVTLLSIALFVLVVDFSIQLASYIADFVKFRLLSSKGSRLEKELAKLKDLRANLYYELDQVEDRIIELMPLFDNKLANKTEQSDQVFEGLHQV